MQCCRNSVIFIVASLTFYESLAAKISLISNNGQLLVGKSAQFLCSWKDTEKLDGRELMWNLPGQNYILTYAKGNNSCDGSSLENHNSLGIGYHHLDWKTSVKCINGSSSLLTIDNIDETHNAIRIYCGSHSRSFRSTWYKIDLPTAISKAAITLIDPEEPIMEGANVTLFCAWDPEAQDAYSVKWNWRNFDGEYLGAKSFFSIDYSIPNRTCEGSKVNEWSPRRFIAFPLKGRTHVGCWNESSSFLFITNVSTADDGISINCWGYTFDASYTLHVKGDHCGSQPCKNHGVCINLVETFHCECITGFRGPDCSKMRIWLPVTIGAAIVLVIVLIILISIKVKMLLYPRLQGAVRSDSILSNVHTPYMELGSI